MSRAYRIILPFVVVSGACAGDLSGQVAGLTPPVVPDAPSEPPSEPPVEVEVPQGLTAPEWVIARVNPDDDDGNSEIDWFDLPFEQDDELMVLTLAPSPNGDQVGVSSIELTWGEETTDFRVIHDGEVLLDAEVSTASLPWQAEPLELRVEAGSFRREATLLVQERVDGGEDEAARVVRLSSSPLILNHHLQPTEAVWAVRVNSFQSNNSALIDGYRDELGATFTSVGGSAYDGDVWIQDEFQFATTLSSDGGRLDVIIDSVRDRGLDDFAEDALEGNNSTAITWGRGEATSQDSFGNLEVSPPVEVDGVSYPFGRIYYGATSGGYGPKTALSDMLDDQLVQAPFRVDTSWLCVGHVDEFVSFVPDSSASKGFRMVYADTTAAWQVLESLSPSMSLPRYAGRWTGHGYARVRDLIEDDGLRAYNQDIQELYLDPLLEVFKTELGLDDEDVIAMPSLFEAVWDCENRAASLIPGMANLVVVNPPGEPTRIFMADPFLRSDPADQATDPMIEDVRSRFPEELQLHFLDDWITYHLALGEVHCGTNVRRTPVATWWDTAAHLVGRSTP